MQGRRTGCESGIEGTARCRSVSFRVGPEPPFVNFAGGEQVYNLSQWPEPTDILPTLRSTLAETLRSTLAETLRSTLAETLRSTLAEMESRSESKERPRPMSSSSDDEDDEGYLIVKASSFRQKSFWTWAKGVDFLTIPFTGTKIRCVLGVLEENLEDVDVPCRECVEVWERSGLRDSLQSVQWGGAELLSQDPRLTLFLMACQAAKDYTFMDGVNKILSIRMLDLVLSHGLCHTHIRSLTVVSPSSMFEVGALEAKTLLCREGERGVKVELKGRPDVAVLASGLALNHHLSILLGENKSTTYPNGLSQLIFYRHFAALWQRHFAALWQTLRSTPALRSTLAETLRSTLAETLRSTLAETLRSTLAEMESRSESKERPRPMSSSSDDEDDEGYLIVKASSFRQKSFWTWAKGVDFLTIPFTGTKIRCVLGVLEENLEDVDVPCRECVEVWERSGLRDSLQSVQWGEQSS